MKTNEQKPIVKICTAPLCTRQGGGELFEKLRVELYADAVVLSSQNCFNQCEKAPNISVNGVLLSEINLAEATKRVQSELKNPSLKSDGGGTRSIDELDRVLDEVFEK